jgi:hypothetical protein
MSASVTPPLECGLNSCQAGRLCCLGQKRCHQRGPILVPPQSRSPCHWTPERSNRQHSHLRFDGREHHPNALLIRGFGVQVPDGAPQKARSEAGRLLTRGQAGIACPFFVPLRGTSADPRILEPLVRRSCLPGRGGSGPDDGLHCSAPASGNWSAPISHNPRRRRRGCTAPVGTTKHRLRDEKGSAARIWVCLQLVVGGRHRVSRQ